MSYFWKKAKVLMAFTNAKKLKDSLKTYLFITGADLRNVQELLGQYSSKTTVPIVIGIHSYE